MSLRLAQAAARMMDHGVTLRRYAASGAYQDLTTTFKMLPFSSDAKRKTTAYDRLGISAVQDFLRSGEVLTQAGDYVVMNPGTSFEDIFLAGKLVQDFSVFPTGTATTQWLTELYFCNARISVDRVAIVTDEDTGIPSEVITRVFSDIPAAIVTGEIFVSRPYNEFQDRFQVRITSNVALEQGEDIFIQSWPATDGKFEHTKYTVLGFEPELIGAHTAVVHRSVDGG